MGKKYLKLETKNFEVQSSTNEEGEDDSSDRLIFGDMLCLILEIVNAALLKNFSANPHLIYALLQQQQFFSNFRSSAKFSVLIENIDMVNIFFNSRLEEIGSEEVNYEAILKMITKFIEAQPRPIQLNPLPEIGFKYEEERNADEFFCPYSWSLFATQNETRIEGAHHLEFFKHFSG